MVSVLRAQGLRVVIFANDHHPAHVHVFGDGHARIDLIGTEGAPTLVWADGMTRGEIRRSMQIVTQQRDMLLARWERIHGRTD